MVRSLVIALAIGLVLSVLLISALSSSVGQAPAFQPGDKVAIAGRGYYNPLCREANAESRLWIDSNEAIHVCRRSVPDRGFAMIAANEEGEWLQNGCFRACGQLGCGWYPAESLKIVAEIPTPTSRPTLRPSPTALPSATPDLRPKYLVYYVAEGETLGEIASRFGVSVAELQRLNGITNPNLLTIGQKLLIPNR